MGGPGGQDLPPLFSFTPKHHKEGEREREGGGGGGSCGCVLMQHVFAVTRSPPFPKSCIHPCPGLGVLEVEDAQR